MLSALILIIYSSFGAKTKKVAVADLRITNQIPDWKERDGTFSAFDPKKLFELIDGGAPEYNERGLIEGIHQQLVGKDKRAMELFAEDFGSPDNAGQMLSYKKASLGEAIPFPGIDSSRAFAYQVIGGYYVFIVIDRFYLELLLTGVKDKDASCAEVSRFINYYATRIQKLSGVKKLKAK